MPAIDLREAFRFIVSGGLATLGNLAAVWIARGFMAFPAALLCGIAVGMAMSFLLSKFFAFRSRDIAAAPGEAARFLVVYCCGLVIYYLGALAARSALLGMRAPADAADLLGVLFGSGLMVVTGYFGHRFFTYRTATA